MLGNVLKQLFRKIGAPLVGKASCQRHDTRLRVGMSMPSNAGLREPVADGESAVTA